MPNTSITNVFRELFSAPLDAACNAERDYRKMWAQWLESQLGLLVDENGALRAGVDLDEILTTAPTVSIDGIIECAITMRIASVTKYDIGIGGGLAIGPIYASGSFGLSTSQSQESVFQASTRFTISNTNRDLTQYLAERNIAHASPDDIKNAVEMLRREDPGKE